MLKSIFVFSLFILIAIIFCIFGMQERLLYKKPLVSKSLIFEIKRGDSLRQITQNLVQLHIIENPFWFKYLAYQQNLARHLKAGEYILESGATAFDILTLFYSGKTKLYSITFPEGWTFKQVLKALKDNPNLQHSLDNAEDKALLTYIGSDYSYPEGLFFPDTYFFEKNTLDIDLLKRAHQKMQDVLKKAWENRADKLPLASPYQALILASIVEKETAIADERKQIAGVFSRRLQKGMLLQTDPTVIYGMGEEYHGDIRTKDLKQPTRYNTYINPGLPPTPIALPGKEAISAALHPDDAESLYFVASENGHHVFSNNLVEHEKFVRQYQK